MESARLFTQIELSIVVPVYNEGPGLDVFYRTLKNVLDALACSSEVVFVDDGSTDGSFEFIRQLAVRQSGVRGIRFSRNFGHQIALTAGMDHAQGQAVITMDADLQHPPELVARLWEKYREGFDVVYTVRTNRQTGFLKQAAASFFYKIINLWSDTRIEPEASDFRLLGPKALAAMRQLREQGRFLRGMVSWIGFRQASVPFSVGARYTGRTKYSLSKMIRLALDGLTAFSSKPLRVSGYLGLTVCFSALIYAFHALGACLTGRAVSGWTWPLISVLLTGGVQLVSLGLLGEYIGRILRETQNRPLYLIEGDTAVPVQKS